MEASNLDFFVNKIPSFMFIFFTPVPGTSFITCHISPFFSLLFYDSILGFLNQIHNSTHCDVFWQVGKLLLNALLYPGIRTNLQKNSLVAIFHTSVKHTDVYLLCILFLPFCSISCNGQTCALSIPLNYVNLKLLCCNEIFSVSILSSFCL